MNKPPGRPRVASPVSGLPRLNLRVPAAVKEALSAWCREIEQTEGDDLKRSLNWLAVEILREAVKRHKEGK